MSTPFPLGKLPAEILQTFLADAPISDPRVIQGPGVGLDCAVIDMGDTLLVAKSDPITFATDEIGHYLVQVNVNDIATTGAAPRWLLATLLLPEAKTDAAMLEEIRSQLYAACRSFGVSLIGGHTEITGGLDRPIAVGALIGEAAPDEFITPRGARPGDAILLTKGVPIEGTSILAREFPERLSEILTAAELQRAQAFLHDPGIGVLADAQTATKAGRVTAMHDPTEGGAAAALWELAMAAQCSLLVDETAVPIPDLSARICAAFDLDPLATIASGALILTVAPEDEAAICRALRESGIACAVIGVVERKEASADAVTVYREKEGDRRPLPFPQRDAITTVFET